MCAEEVMDNAAGRNQYFTFLLGDEVFALEIGKVREVLEYTTITKVPRMPEFMRGVINLRGNVVPVIDLRYKLGMGTVTRTVDTCIIIVEIMIDGEIIPMGALADSVKEVTELNPDQISPPPKMGIQVDNRFIRGMGKQGEKFLIILDIEKVFTTEECEVLQRSGDETPSEISQEVLYGSQ